VMDLREGDTVASVAVIREGRLSQVNGRNQESENGEPDQTDSTETETAVAGPN
jgi:hypothetical protein